MDPNGLIPVVFVIGFLVNELLTSTNPEFPSFMPVLLGASLSEHDDIESDIFISTKYHLLQA